MISIEEINILNVQIKDEDIESFVNIIIKLVQDVKRPGFKNKFTNDETKVLLTIAEGLGIEIVENKVNLIADTDTIKQ